MKNWCKNLQIQFEAIVEYFPETNEIVERCNWSIQEKTNAIRFEAGLPGTYCELTYICIIYLKNKSLSREKNITPWEVWYNKCPSIKHYKVFGYLAYVQIPKKKKEKLTNKKWKRVFMSYHENTNRIWKIWDSIDRRIGEVISVTFDETFLMKLSVIN